MVNSINQTTVRGIVFNLDNMIHFSQAQSIQSGFLVARSMNTTSNLLNFYSCHNKIFYPLNTFSTLIPRVSAMVFASRISASAVIVALTKLWGLEEPLDFAKQSFTPTLSNTARIAPPATTPVPVEAGIISTWAPPNFASASCGTVPLITGTRTKFFLAASTPLAIAAVTSPALPRPQPIIPFSLPTTTIAEKVKVRPPLVTFVTRLIATNLSFNSISLLILTLLIAIIFKI